MKKKAKERRRTMREVVFRTVLAAALATGVAACDRVMKRGGADERTDSLYRAAMADYSAGRLDEAIKGFEKVVVAHPENVSARFQLGCLLQDRRRDYLGAICQYREYVALSRGGDKTALAKERAALCERLLAPELAQRMKLLDNSALLAELEALKRDKATLAKDNGRYQKDLESLDREVTAAKKESEGLRRLISGVGTEDELAKPKKLEISEKDLLDDDAGAVDRAKVAADIRQLVAEEADEQKAAPFGATTRKVEQTEPVKTIEHPDEYVVQEGDTLYRLAVRFYGKISAWRRIREANKATISTDGRIRAGQKIVLPR